MQTNVAAPEGAVRGTVLLNSAGAMNNKGVIGDWRIVAVYPLLLLIDFLLSIPAVSAALFKNLARKENISQVREGEPELGRGGGCKYQPKLNHNQRKRECRQRR